MVLLHQSCQRTQVANERLPGCKTRYKHLDQKRVEAQVKKGNTCALGAKEPPPMNNFEKALLASKASTSVEMTANLTLLAVSGKS